MKLTVKKRVSERKSDAKVVRRQGDIPAVLYAKGDAGENVAIKAAEFSAALRKIKAGCLPTTIFTLTDGKKERKVVVKGIQYHPTSYQVSHLDFEELAPGEKISVNVPIRCVGAAESVGVKLGGFLREVTRFVKVECPSNKIPAEFEVDVKDLGIRQTKRIKDINVPQGVKVLAPSNEVIAVIAKR